VAEGAEYRFLAQPIRFLHGSNGQVGAVECLECELGEPDSDGRRRPIPIDGSNFTVEADTVVCALGYKANPEIGRTTAGLVIHKNGLLQVDSDEGATPRPGIYAAGDVVTGPDLVVTAMAAARRTAKAICRYIEQTGS
ncbi:MAG: FAD-dependent oxidoreductase, partial [Anaerolineales bacterium]